MAAAADKTRVQIYKLGNPSKPLSDSHSDSDSDSHWSLTRSSRCLSRHVLRQQSAHHLRGGQDSAEHISQGIREVLHWGCVASPSPSPSLACLSVNVHCWYLAVLCCVALCRVGEKVAFTRVFLYDGAEVATTDEIFNGDKLIFSSGEDYQRPDDDSSNNWDRVYIFILHHAVIACVARRRVPTSIPSQCGRACHCSGQHAVWLHKRLREESFAVARQGVCRASWECRSAIRLHSTEHGDCLRLSTARLCGWEARRRIRQHQAAKIIPSHPELTTHTGRSFILSCITTTTTIIIIIIIIIVIILKLIL